MKKAKKHCEAAHCSCCKRAHCSHAHCSHAHCHTSANHFWKLWLFIPLLYRVLRVYYYHHHIYLKLYRKQRAAMELPLQVSWTKERMKNPAEMEEWIPGQTPEKVKERNRQKLARLDEEGKKRHMARVLYILFLNGCIKLKGDYTYFLLYAQHDDCMPSFRDNTDYFKYLQTCHLPMTPALRLIQNKSGYCFPKPDIQNWVFKDTDRTKTIERRKDMLQSFSDCYYSIQVQAAETAENLISLPN